ncbi:hypothetical protein LTR49_020687 [Elasticomyces elasticus]|nr:hypothetical protein LTR49_020687 [Elasticomyces elasticus]
MADVTLDPPLLRIPPELRNLIYELVLIKDDHISVKDWAFCCVGPALLQTSRLIRSEASPLFYGGNKFEGSWVTDFPSMPLYVTPASLRLMKHLRFNGDAYMWELVESEAKKKEVLRFYLLKLSQIMVKVGGGRTRSASAVAEVLQFSLRNEEAGTVWAPLKQLAEFELVEEGGKKRWAKMGNGA